MQYLLLHTCWNLEVPFAISKSHYLLVIFVSTSGFSSLCVLISEHSTESSGWLLDSAILQRSSISFLDNVCTNDTHIYSFHLVLSPEFQLCCLKFWQDIHTQLCSIFFLQMNTCQAKLHPSSIHTGLSMPNSFPSSITPTFPTSEAWKLHHYWRSLSYYTYNQSLTHRNYSLKTLWQPYPFSFSCTHTPITLSADTITKLMKMCHLPFQCFHCPHWTCSLPPSTEKCFLALNFFQNRIT